MEKRRWNDFSTTQQAAIIGLGAVQVCLAVAAWRDLASRQAHEVRGKKSVWAAVIAVNFIGPAAYFAKGRKES